MPWEREYSHEKKKRIKKLRFRADEFEHVEGNSSAEVALRWGKNVVPKDRAWKKNGKNCFGALGKGLNWRDRQNNAKSRQSDVIVLIKTLIKLLIK